ncbi:MAG: hypothetical protein ACOCQ4_00025 [bacterium]
MLLLSCSLQVNSQADLSENVPDVSANDARHTSPNFHEIAEYVIYPKAGLSPELIIDIGNQDKQKEFLIIADTIDYHNHDAPFYTKLILISENEHGLLAPIRLRVLFNLAAKDIMLLYYTEIAGNNFISIHDISDDKGHTQKLLITADNETYYLTLLNLNNKSSHCKIKTIKKQGSLGMKYTLYLFDKKIRINPAIFESRNNHYYTEKVIAPYLLHIAKQVNNKNESTSYLANWELPDVGLKKEEIDKSYRPGRNIKDFFNNDLFALFFRKSISNDHPASLELCLEMKPDCPSCNNQNFARIKRFELSGTDEIDSVFAINIPHNQIFYSGAYVIVISKTGEEQFVDVFNYECGAIACDFIQLEFKNHAEIFDGLARKDKIKNALISQSENSNAADIREKQGY